MRRVLLGLVMSVSLATALPPAVVPSGSGAGGGERRDPRPRGLPARRPLHGAAPHGHRAGHARASARHVGQRLAVVYLETAPRGAFEERPGPTVVLDQRNETFVPHVLAITTGTTVQFLNSDKTYHNVFSLSRPKRFDLGRYPTAAPRRSGSTARGSSACSARSIRT